MSLLRSDCGVPDDVSQWPCIPAMPGDWREVPAEMIAALLENADDDNAAGLKSLPRPVSRMRAQRPGFYDGWLLLEALAPISPRAHGVIRLLLGPGHCFVLDGSSPPIHAINVDSLAIGGSMTRAIEYLRFFSGLIRGAEGPFRIVETPGDLEPFQQVAADADFAELVEPIVPLGGDGNCFESKATVLYGRDLIRCHFRVQASGMVEMVDDDIVRKDFIDRAARYDGIWQIVPRARTQAPRSAGCDGST